MAIKYAFAYVVNCVYIVVDLKIERKVCYCIFFIVFICLWTKLWGTVSC